MPRRPNVAGDGQRARVGASQEERSGADWTLFLLRLEINVQGIRKGQVHGGQRLQRVIRGFNSPTQSIW